MRVRVPQCRYLASGRADTGRGAGRVLKVAAEHVAKVESGRVGSGLEGGEDVRGDTLVWKVCGMILHK